MMLIFFFFSRLIDIDVVSGAFAKLCFYITDLRGLKIPAVTKNCKIKKPPLHGWSTSDT